MDRRTVIKLIFNLSKLGLLRSTHFTELLAFLSQDLSAVKPAQYDTLSKLLREVGNLHCEEVDSIRVLGQA